MTTRPQPWKPKSSPGGGHLISRPTHLRSSLLWPPAQCSWPGHGFLIEAGIEESRHLAEPAKLLSLVPQAHLRVYITAMELASFLNSYSWCWNISSQKHGQCPTRTCTRMFMAASFIQSPNWKTTRKQLKYPSTGERIFKNVAYPHSELLLNNKKKKLLKHSSTWMNLKSIMLSDRHPVKKTTYPMMSFKSNVQARNNYRQKADQ